MLALVSLLAFAQPAPQPGRLVAIFVVDGLRPDSINQADTPTLDRLRTEGVDYRNSHSIFPTSTRVNAAALVTGTYPARHGIVGNSMFVAGVNPQAPFDTADHTQLMRLEDAEGRVVTTPTLAEVLGRHGRTGRDAQLGDDRQWLSAQPAGAARSRRRDSRPLRSREDGGLSA